MIFCPHCTEALLRRRRQAASSQPQTKNFKNTNSIQ